MSRNAWTASRVAASWSSRRPRWALIMALRSSGSAASTERTSGIGMSSPRSRRTTCATGTWSSSSSGSR